MRAVAVLAAFVIGLHAAASKEYPEDSLLCYSSLTQPKHKLICPQARNKYCVKQVSTLTQNLCGATQYFGDIYTNNECQFKKCSDTCTAGPTTFEYQGKQYTRTTYCCKSDYCNSASSLSGHFQLLFVIISVVCLFLML